MIRETRQFATRAEADAYRERFLRLWHPGGYGSRVTVCASGEGFVAYAERFASCD